ncbi:hypothetical protein [Clostridium massiliodielmoense]|uniref:hypothetical protein n=1 Tax=Clostridium massiliodielmoense TaxID=1776385 RepID=UPI000A26B3FA|nr:hypothetical protein [Clostridium massiliodielmoense]
MKFFNSIKKIVLRRHEDEEDIKNSHKIDNTELGVLTKAVNFTLDNYRKSIDKISKQVTSAEFENDFYNYNLNIKKIEDINIDIKEINEEISKINEKNIELEESIKIISEEILSKEVDLQKMRDEEARLKEKVSSSELDDDEKEELRQDIFNVVESTKKLEEKIINQKVKVDVSTMDIRANEESISNKNKEIQNKKNEKLCLMTLSYSLDECLKFAEEIKEKTSFIQYCFQGLIDYAKGEHNNALNSFDSYFKREDEPYENYYIRQIYSQLLIENKRYEEAKQYAMEALKDKPEEVEIHKILSKVHEALGENEEQALENSIVSMLQG